MALRAPLHGAAAFAELALADPSPPLIAPFIALGSVTLLFGPPSSGKTHLTISMAAALVAGTPLWGVYPTQKSRVLIVQADMNSALYQERIRPNAALLTDNTLILATDGFPIDVCALKPTDPLVIAIREFAPHIVFVDTLRKTHNFGEIDDTTPDRVYTAWRTLLPGTAFVFLHHSRKLSTSPDAAKIIAEAFRGSGAWAASADTIIAQRRVRRANNSDWMTRLQFIRTRSCAEPAPILLRLTEELMLEPVAETRYEKALLAWIVANPKTTRVEGVKWLLAQRDSANNPLCSQATAYRVWDKIVRGEIRQGE